MDVISRKALKLMRVLCTEYKNRIDSGCNMDRAAIFGSSADICSHFFYRESPENVDHICHELNRAGYVDCFFADGVAYEVVLTDYGIKQTNFRIAQWIKEILSFLSQFIP